MFVSVRRIRHVRYVCFCLSIYLWTYSFEVMQVIYNVFVGARHVRNVCFSSSSFDVHTQSEHGEHVTKFKLVNKAKTRGFY